MSKIVHMRPSGLPLREPEQVCEECGARGTVGRAMRTDQAGAACETHRFCATCWPEHSARLRARWNEEDRLARQAWFRDPGGAAALDRGTGFESATWHGTLDFVTLINQSLRPSQPPSPSQLSEMAAELENSAAEYVGEMPFEIALFIQTHRAPQH
jgi:hypothetical protein